MTTTPKRKPPVPYSAAIPRQVEKLCQLGVSDVRLADLLGVHKDTVQAWKGKHPEFVAAMRRGRAVADAKVEKSLYERARGYRHKAVKIFMPAGASAPVIVPYVEHYPPDTAAASFWLTNRAAGEWKHKQSVEATVRTVESLTDEQLQALEMALDLAPDGDGVHRLEGEE